jgi:protein-glutamine gamma-glutamyltransferase
MVMGWLFAVPVAKSIRRRRRRRRRNPGAAVAPAWFEARDRLYDHGMRVNPSMTVRDLAAVTGPTYGDQIRLSLVNLGECVDLARWSGFPAQASTGREFRRRTATG